MERPAIEAGRETLPGPYVRLAVEDTGTGISPGNLARIFDPYFTTKKVDKGTGMGLSIVHGIVNSYGGFVEVESELSRGSTFFVYIPQSETPRAGAGPVPSGSGGERILLVDDDEVALEMTRVMIEMLGYKADSKKNWIEALNLLGANPYDYDLVLMNQVMAGMTGRELSRKMLQIRPDLPIIIEPQRVPCGFPGAGGRRYCL